MAEPPSYAAASTTESRAQLRSTELLTFTLDKTLVFPSAPPSVALYEFNGNKVSKLRYKLKGEGDIQHSRSEDMYQILPSRTPHYLYIGGRTQLLVFGKGSRRNTYEAATMTPGWGRGRWKIPGFFRTRCALFHRSGEVSEVQWLDWQSSQLVALEKRPGQEQQDSDRLSSPTLELRVDLAEKKRDLLVACWIARLSKEKL